MARFSHSAPRRRRRILRYALVIAAAIALATLLDYARHWNLPFIPREAAEVMEAHFTICSEEPAANCVIDGDTVMLGKRRVRLAGFDAPELEGACAAESDLARKSREELRGWLNAGPVRLDGGGDPPRDRYGRELREATRIDARGRLLHLSDHMIDAGLARAASWGEESGGWCQAFDTIRGEVA